MLDKKNEVLKYIWLEKEINKSQEKVATGYPEELGKQLDQHGRYHLRLQQNLEKP